MIFTAPMWRNGRRNGLKIRSREKRGMGSNPIIGTSEKPICEGKIGQIDQSSVTHGSTTKSTKRSLFDKYSPSVDSGSLEWRRVGAFSYWWTLSANPTR